MMILNNVNFLLFNKEIIVHLNISVNETTIETRIKNYLFKMDLIVFKCPQFTISNIFLNYKPLISKCVQHP